MAHQLSFQLLLPLLLLLTETCVVDMATGSSWTARLGMNRRSLMSHEDDTLLPPEFVTYFYTQTLDHFNYKPESYTTFQQRYIMNSKYWGGANTSSPIFVYTGQESDITQVVSFAGFVVELASRFNGLLIYIEHRYYGDSMPFGSENEAFQNATTLGFFSSTQALADYAQLIIDLKRNLSAENCPIIALGGSYGGMLASWFRLKYPHIAFGALASSAPILYFDDITPQNGYHVIVSNDFRDTSESCYDTIKQSWSEIDKVAAESNGLLKLSQIFTTCQPFNYSREVRDNIEIRYIAAAQFDNPPDNPVSKVCNAIDGAPPGTDILGRVVAGFNASFGDVPCHHVHDFEPSNKDGWTWQVNI
ncbi:hypothetical protein F0562_001971 [Nyssa sinensis]|uniref:Lysosomal Pro-X carboxypeptidase n=1 Tax=Nyssa sinensis TaxID=561372 RepID=A0A5J5C8I9_9ASTE|nr:hypothetical protein F0562_001971 [Nyssa sinensis]